MSQLIQQKMMGVLATFHGFTMLPDRKILCLEATDNDFKVALHSLSMLAMHQLDTPDVVVLVEAPFDSVESYSREGIVALCGAYDRLVPRLPNPESDPDINMSLPWEPVFILAQEEGTSPESDLERWQRLTAEFIAGFGNYFDKLVYVFLPPNVSSSSDWCEFLNAFLSFDNSKLKIGLIGNLTPLVPLMDDLSLSESQVEHYYFAGQTFDVMAEVLTELEADGQPMAFQRHLTELFQYQEHKQGEQALMSGERALQEATQQGAPMLQVVALTAQYATYVSMSEYSQAQERTEAALAVSQTITPEELPSCAGLVAMCQTNLATAKLLNRRYQSAALSYQMAAAQFEAQDNWMMAYESHRMSALCYRHLKQTDNAWDAGGDALVALYQTPEALWPDGTLPYLGKTLQSLTRWQNDREVAAFEAHMLDCLGEDWSEILGNVQLPTLPAPLSEEVLL